MALHKKRITTTLRKRGAAMTVPEYRELIRRLDILHGLMFDEMGLTEVSDPRISRFVHPLASIMTPLRKVIPSQYPNRGKRSARPVRRAAVCARHSKHK